MEGYVAVAKTEEVPKDGRKRFEVEGKRITVFNIDDEYFAILDTCPHKKTAPLLRGRLDGTAVHCPNHGYRFDLKTGECNVSPDFNTSVFPVKVDGEIIYLGIHL